MTLRDTLTLSDAQFKTVMLTGYSPYSIGMSRNPAIIADFLDASTCREVRRAMDEGEVEPAEVLADGVALDDTARRASSIEVDPTTLTDIERRFDDVRNLLAGHCGMSLRGREGAGFIRYADGGFYRPHRDRATDVGWPEASQRKLAVVVFLNSREFTGGELVIHLDPPADTGDGLIRIVPREGLLVAFDAAHLHEVCPVAGGPRDVIVDWFY